MNRKVFNPLIAGALVVAFTLSSAYCCCAANVIHVPAVKSMGGMASDPCQKAPQKTSHGYCFLQAPTSDKMQVFSLSMPSHGSVAHSPETIGSFQHHSIVLVRTAYGGHPLLLALSIPLYLQTHSLRL